MNKITCIEDLRHAYRRRTPRMFVDYTEAGSWSEKTLLDNKKDFESIYFRQRVAIDVSVRDVTSSMLDQKVSMPVALAPIGLTGMQCADGEIKAAKAAEKFGVPYILSTMSIASIEDVAAKVKSPFWFQLYAMRDEDFISRLIKRAKDAKCSALMLTLDLQILAQRHNDIRNGLSVPPRPTLSNILNLASKGKWLYEMLGAKRWHFGNIVGHVKDISDTSSLASWVADQFDPGLDWNRVAKIKEEWGGKLILKGILDPQDALMAEKVGADAIVVSNHGGRQLDGATSTIRALPKILDTLKTKIEVYIDGGISSGQEVLKSIAMGADGTLIGKAYIYGLGSFGETGVIKTLEIIHKELDYSMALCGKKNLNELNKDILLIPEIKKFV